MKRSNLWSDETLGFVVKILIIFSWSWNFPSYAAWRKQKDSVKVVRDPSQQKYLLASTWKWKKCRFFASAPPSSPFLILKIINLYLAEEINIRQSFQSLIGPRGGNIIKHCRDIEGLQFRIETMRVSADEGTTTFLRWLQGKENIFVFHRTKWKLNVCSCWSHRWLKGPTIFFKMSSSISQRPRQRPGAGGWNNGWQIKGI